MLDAVGTSWEVQEWSLPVFLETGDEDDAVVPASVYRRGDLQVNCRRKQPAR